MHILAHILVVGHKAEIGIQPGGFLVEVTGADIAVKTRGIAFLALNQQQFTVHLETGDPEQHLYTVLREGLGPVDVGGLVEPGGEFHHREYLLAVLHRVDQRVDDAGIPRDTVQADLDLADMGVQGGRFQQVDHVVERVVGVVQEDILVPDRVEDTLVLVQPRNPIGRQRLEREARFGPTSGKSMKSLELW